MRASVSVSTTFDHDHKHEDEHGQRGCTYLDVPVVRFTGGEGKGEGLARRHDQRAAGGRARRSERACEPRR